MTAPVIKGWCPGALRPMLSGDGWVVRIRPMAGRLAQSQAAGIADLSRQYGNGLIDLSSRANVQIRGVTEASHPPLIDGLRALGLIDATPQDEAARNIIVTPFWDHGDGTTDLAQTLGQAMAAGPVLPSKFGLALDTGPLPVLRDVSADIRIERGADGGLIVRGRWDADRGQGAGRGGNGADPCPLVRRAWCDRQPGPDGGADRLGDHASGCVFGGRRAARLKRKRPPPALSPKAR